MMTIAKWIAEHELWFLGLASPLLLFPIGMLPWVGLGLIALTWLCRGLVHRQFSLLTGLEIPSLILILMALVGYWISVDPTLSRARFWNILLDLAVFYGLANALQPQKQLRWILGGLLAVTFGVVALSFLGTDWNMTRFFQLPWLYGHIPTLVRGLPNSGVAAASDLINPRWVGITLGALVPVLLACFFATRSPWLRLLSGVIITLGTGLLLLTQTLQGVIGLCAGLFFLLVWRSRWWLLLLVPVIGLLAGALALTDRSQLGQLLFTLNNPAGEAIVLRLDIWSRALAMLGDMPLTGIGLNTFSLIQTHFYPGHLLGPEPHAHNLYLQTALDLGFPGLAAFLWFFIAWGGRVRRNASLSHGPEYTLLLAGIVAGAISYLAHGFIDAMMMGAKPSVLIWGLMGIAIAKPTSSPVKSSPPAPRATLLSKYSPVFSQLLPLLLLLIAGLVSLLLKPASLYMNLGTIQAHLSLYSAQTGQAADFTAMDAAKENLLEVLTLDQNYLSAYELLGRISAWEGDFAAAIQAFAQRVALDGEDALWRYFPPGSLLRQMEGPEQAQRDDWADLIKVYSQWMTRFPERAPTYAELGLVWQCYQSNPEQASRVVNAGLERQALPAGLLSYYESILTQGDSSPCLQK